MVGNSPSRMSEGTIARLAPRFCDLAHKPKRLLELLFGGQRAKLNHRLNWRMCDPSHSQNSTLVV
jgi:hypothetical protein